MTTEKEAIKNGKALMKRKEFDAAIALLSSASDQHRNSAAIHYALGNVLYKAGQKKQAISVLEEAIRLDPFATAQDIDLLRSRPKNLVERQAIHRFVIANLQEIQEGAFDRIGTVMDADPAIFVYWDRGIAAAPPVVQMCYAKLLRMHGTRVRFLDATAARDISRLPQSLAEKQDTHPAFYSDGLRVDLLSRLGGIWVDATCYVTGDLVKNAWSAGEFTGLFHSPTRISNWHMASGQGNAIPALMLSALDVFWRHHNKPIHYHLFHHIFESLSLLDARFAARLKAAKKNPAKSCHDLQKVMLTQVPSVDVDQILAATYIQKLTYKYESDPTGTVLEHLLDG